MAQHGMPRQSNMMYSNPGENNDLNGSANGHHMQVPGPHQSEELYKRSVTLIIWYKAHATPLRFPHPVPNFPFMQLSQFPSLVSSLSLNDNSFVDTYNSITGQWEQHMIDTIRRVESEQRVLYRLRKSLLEGLEEDECVGLQEELTSQPQSEQARHNRLKRTAPDMANDASPPSKYFISDQMYSDGTQHQSPGQSYAVTPYPSSMSNKTNGHGQSVAMAGSPTNTTSHVPGPSNSSLKQSYMFSQNGMYGVPVHSPPSTPAPSSASAPPSSSAQTNTMHTSAPPTPTPQPSASAPFPPHPHPPLKRWPNDYTVSEIANGFKQMDDVVAQIPTMTQRAAFERVFGCRYVKSTVCRHRGVWRRAEENVRNAFIAMGRDERAMWGEFVRRVEGRSSGLHGGGVGNIGVGADVNGGGGVGVLQVQVPQMGGMTMPVQVRGEVVDDGAQEAVMGSLGPPPQNDPHHVGENPHGMVQVMGMNGQAGPGQQGDGGMVHVSMFSASAVRTGAADEHVGVYNTTQLLGGDQG